MHMNKRPDSQTRARLSTEVECGSRTTNWEGGSDLRDNRREAGQRIDVFLGVFCCYFDGNWTMGLRIETEKGETGRIWGSVWNR